ncbi:hypothetical protein SDC9_89902 [bioreactor metagenome]|uniref:Uncharacterized protein n=1 Tax=bioreactor metagenome TaxID=1076179 RepID=A0A644ZQH1_9ZZZZ
MIDLTTDGKTDTNTNAGTIPKLIISLVVVCNHAHEIAQIDIAIDGHLQPSSTVGIIFDKNKHIITFCKECMQVIVAQVKRLSIHDDTALSVDDAGNTGNDGKQGKTQLVNLLENQVHQERKDPIKVDLGQFAFILKEQRAGDIHNHGPVVGGLDVKTHHTPKLIVEPEDDRLSPSSAHPAALFPFIDNFVIDESTDDVGDSRSVQVQLPCNIDSADPRAFPNELRNQGGICILLEIVVVDSHKPLYPGDIPTSVKKK